MGRWLDMWMDTFLFQLTWTLSSKFESTSFLKHYFFPFDLSDNSAGFFPTFLALLLAFLPSHLLNINVALYVLPQWPHLFLNLVFQLWSPPSPYHQPGPYFPSYMTRPLDCHQPCKLDMSTIQLLISPHSVHPISISGAIFAQAQNMAHILDALILLPLPIHHWVFCPFCLQHLPVLFIYCSLHCPELRPSHYILPQWDRLSSPSLWQLLVVSPLPVFSFHEIKSHLAAEVIFS